MNRYNNIGTRGKTTQGGGAMQRQNVSTGGGWICPPHTPLCPAVPQASTQAVQTQTFISTPLSSGCPIPNPDGSNYDGYNGGFCQWKVNFRNTFLMKYKKCAFLDKRKAILHSKLQGLIATNRNPLWIELLQYKLMFIRALGIEYGCYQAGNGGVNLKQANRNIYKI